MSSRDEEDQLNIPFMTVDLILPGETHTDAILDGSSPSLLVERTKEQQDLFDDIDAIMSKLKASGSIQTYELLSETLGQRYVLKYWLTDKLSTQDPQELTVSNVPEGDVLEWATKRLVQTWRKQCVGTEKYWIDQCNAAESDNSNAANPLNKNWRNSIKEESQFGMEFGSGITINRSAHYWRYGEEGNFGTYLFVSQDPEEGDSEEEMEMDESAPN